MASTPVSPKVTSGTLAAAVTTVVAYLLHLVPFIAAMPDYVQAALLVLVTAGVTYAAGYIKRDPARHDPDELAA